METIKLINGGKSKIEKGFCVYINSDGKAELADAKISKDSARVAGILAGNDIKPGESGDFVFDGALELSNEEWSKIIGSDSGLNSNAQYWLDPRENGKITTIPPMELGYSGRAYLVRVGIAMDNNKFLVSIKDLGKI